MTKVRAMVGAVLGLVFLGCGGGDGAGADSDAQSGEVASTESVKPAGPAATGTVIEVKMITDEKGNYFQPAEIEAKPGDVLHFVLVSGAHNFHIPAETNAGKTGLPGPSEILQLPGQTWDYTVALAPGHYNFQCDPHAALGMVGMLEVEDD
jgi:plastocyanin